MKKSVRYTLYGSKKSVHNSYDIVLISVQNPRLITPVPKDKVTLVDIWEMTKEMRMETIYVSQKERIGIQLEILFMIVCDQRILS